MDLFVMRSSHYGKQRYRLMLPHLQLMAQVDCKENCLSFMGVR